MPKVDPADHPIKVQEDVPEKPINITKLFRFQDIDTVIRLAHVLGDFYTETNHLYKNPTDHKYYLVLSKGEHSPEDFNKVCNILTEYSTQLKYSEAEQAYFEEHFDTIVAGNALQALGQV